MPIGSRFAKYMSPILDALRDLGGSARPGEVYDWIAEHMRIPNATRAELHSSGTSRFENDVAWARFYLVRTGYLDASKRGVWSLTERGRVSAMLSDEEIAEIIRVVQTQSQPDSQIPGATDAQIEQALAKQAEEEAPEEISRGYREKTLEILQALPADGFERHCQRILRESGFQQVKVTGRSGDGGIDGIGVLQVNPFVSFKILFQCKRWKTSVGPAVVRDFRGAMMGRADKGLILTTAQAEAVRDGASPIEIVDGLTLVSLLEQLELGLVPRTTYEIDYKFFEEFNK
jgi:restriction system protein